MSFEWSDLRYFLAVARTGTTLGAARLLGVNQTTCARRIAALERSLGVVLFERLASGYRLTSLGTALVLLAEQAEAGALEFARSAEKVARSERRIIRFTTSDWMAEQIAQAAVAEFVKLRPDVRVVMDIRSDQSDLTGGQADVALRGGFLLDEPTLIVRKVADTPWAFYCAPSYAKKHGAPRSMSEALQSPLALPEGAAEAILRQVSADISVCYSSNSTLALIDAIAGGRFVGTLPRSVGDPRNDLQFCCPVEYSTPSLWIVYPERLRGALHIREFVDSLSDEVKRWRHTQQHVTIPKV